MPPSHLENRYHQQVKTRPARVMGLSLIVLIAASAWGILLPRLARLPYFQDFQRRAQAEGIDATALFYTDHPRMWRDRTGNPSPTNSPPCVSPCFRSPGTTARSHGEMSVTPTRGARRTTNAAVIPRAGLLKQTAAPAATYCE